VAAARGSRLGEWTGDGGGASDGVSGRDGGGREWKRATRGGPTGVIVTSQLGGQIFGFDIDQNSNEGILSESQTVDGQGHTLAAVETFDQMTGAIIRIEKEVQGRGDDFVTLGVVGRSVGLVEHDHVVSLLNVERSFLVLDPLRRNRFTGMWTPPVGTDHIVTQVSRDQGIDEVAVFATDITNNFEPIMFSSNVAANTFGPVVTITDEDFVNGSDPKMAYDSATNQAVLGHAKLGNPFVEGRSRRSI
jgi:hypothetical protein